VDWIGSLRVAERSAERVVLSLSRATRLAGWVVAAAGAVLVAPAYAVHPWLATVPGALALLGLTLATMDRRIVFDRAAGTVSQEQRVFGIASRVQVPMFHVRAVIVHAAARGYVAFVDRRVGEPIYLDEARRVARLMKLAEAVAEVTGVRLEYQA
jgi:hypothetical protein